MYPPTHAEVKVVPEAATIAVLLPELLVLTVPDPRALSATAIETMVVLLSKLSSSKNTLTESFALTATS